MKDIELRHCIISERTREAITHPIFGYDPDGQQQIFTDADATAEKILNITGEKGLLTVSLNYDWFPYLPYIKSDGQWVWYNTLIDEYYWGFNHKPLARDLWERMIQRRHG